MLLENSAAVQVTHFAMGTVMTHKAFGPHARDGLAAVCQEIDWIEGLFSRFLPDSEISRVNASAGKQCEPVSFDTFEVLSQSVNYSRLCPGCFDVTIAPLVQLWKTGKDTLNPPDDASLRQALALVDDHDLTLDPWEMTAGLRRAGQAVDLGGIGKGYAGDKILETYRECGVTSAYSNLGGNVVTLGAKPDGSPWQVGIQHPRREDQLIGAVAVAGESVVTSGDYQRYFTGHDGRRYHHILDPRTGYPAGAGLISVTIVAEQSLAADALSTILFVAGMEKGLEYLRSFPRTEAILVDSDLRVTVTGGLRHRFQAAEGLDVTILEG